RDPSVVHRPCSFFGPSLERGAACAFWLVHTARFAKRARRTSRTASRERLPAELSDEGRGAAPSARVSVNRLEGEGKWEQGEPEKGRQGRARLSRVWSSCCWSSDSQLRFRARSPSTATA